VHDYDYYLFDWDGTLMNSTEIWVQAMHENLLKYNLNLPREVLLASMGDWKDLIKHGLPADEHPKYHIVTGELAAARMPAAPLYEGAKEMLHALKKEGKKLGLVTASRPMIIEAMLAKHGLDDIFEVIVTSDDVAEHKPHPAGILKALEQLGATDKTRAVMIGDTTRDTLAAKNAGIDHIIFYPVDAHFALEELTVHGKPVAVIREWTQFAPHIQR